MNHAIIKFMKNWGVKETKIKNKNTNQIIERAFIYEKKL